MENRPTEHEKCLARHKQDLFLRALPRLFDDWTLYFTFKKQMYSEDLVAVHVDSEAEPEIMSMHDLTSNLEDLCWALYQESQGLGHFYKIKYAPKVMLQLFDGTVIALTIPRGPTYYKASNLKACPAATKGNLQYTVPK